MEIGFSCRALVTGGREPRRQAVGREAAQRLDTAGSSYHPRQRDSGERWCGGSLR